MAKKTKNDTKKRKNRHQLLRIGLKWGFGFLKMVKSVKIGPEMVNIARFGQKGSERVRWGLKG